MRHHCLVEQVLARVFNVRHHCLAEPVLAGVPPRTTLLLSRHHCCHHCPHPLPSLSPLPPLPPLLPPLPPKSNRCHGWSLRPVDWLGLWLLGHGSGPWVVQALPGNIMSTESPRCLVEQQAGEKERDGSVVWMSGAGEKKEMGAWRSWEKTGGRKSPAPPQPSPSSQRAARKEFVFLVGGGENRHGRCAGSSGSKHDPRTARARRPLPLVGPKLCRRRETGVLLK